MAAVGFMAGGIDYLSGLPAELLHEIISLLAPQDASTLLRVNKRLSTVVRGFNSYWKSACIDDETLLRREDVEYHLRTHAQNFSCAWELYAAKEKHSLLTTMRLLKSATLSRRYRAKNSFGCKFAKDGIIVEVVRVPAGGKGQPKKEAEDVDSATVQEVIVAKLDPEKRAFHKRFSCKVQGGCQHHVITAYATENHLVLGTECGFWAGWEISTNTELYRWKGCDLKETSSCTGYCHKCFTVVCPSLDIDSQCGIQYYWSLHIVKLGKQKQPPQALTVRFPATHIHDNFAPFCFAFQKVYIVPGSEEADPSGFCKSHRIFLQCGSMVAIYKLETPGTLHTEPLQVLCTVCEDPQSRMERNLCPCDYEPNGLMVLSADQQLLGVVHGFSLHLWDLNTFKKWCVDIELWSPFTELLALGRVYSVLGSDEDQGHLQVICTASGEEVNEVSCFAKKGRDTMADPYLSLFSLLRKPGVSFLGMMEWSWTNDYNSVCPSTTPFLIYHNERKKTIEGVYFAPLSKKDARVNQLHNGKIPVPALMSDSD